MLEVRSPMPTKPTNEPEGLRTMLAQALQAYELALAMRIKAEREAESEQQQHLSILQEQQKTQKQQIQVDHKRDSMIATAEKERLGHLLAAIEQVRKASYDLLEKAGLAHIAGAPLRLEETAAPVRRKDEAIAKDFGAAQLAYIDLRTTLFQLATAFADAERWEEARRVVESLLDNTKSPLYDEALNLFCETYYQPARAALQLEGWAEARQGFTKILTRQASYKDTNQLLRETYLRPAQQALDTKHYDTARLHLEDWLKKHKDDNEVYNLLRETYFRPAQQALDTKSYDTARSYLET